MWAGRGQAARALDRRPGRIVHVRITSTSACFCAYSVAGCFARRGCFESSLSSQILTRGGGGAPPRHAPQPGKRDRPCPYIWAGGGQWCQHGSTPGSTCSVIKMPREGIRVELPCSSYEESRTARQGEQPSVDGMTENATAQRPDERGRAEITTLTQATGENDKLPYLALTRDETERRGASRHSKAAARQVTDRQAQKAHFPCRAMKSGQMPPVIRPPRGSPDDDTSRLPDFGREVPIYVTALARSFQFTSN